MGNERERRISERGEWRPSIRPTRIESGPREKAMALIRLHVEADRKTYWVMLERPWDHKPLAFPGGDIKFGETRIEAVVRETFEETRLGLGEEAARAAYLGPVQMREVRRDWEDIHLYLFEKTIPDVSGLRGTEEEGELALLTSEQLIEKRNEGRLSRNAEAALNILLQQARAT